MAFISLYREWHSQTEPRGLSKLLLSQSPSCSSQLEPHVNLELEHKCFCLSRSSPGAESVPGFKIRVKNRVNVDCFRMTMVAAVRVCVVGGVLSRNLILPLEILRPFELWCWRRLLRVPWTARRSNQSILKEINPEYSLEGMMLKLKRQYFGQLMQRPDSLEKTLMLGKTEGRRRG